jgi:hypothetical protein
MEDLDRSFRISPVPHDAGTASGGPGWSPACSPSSPRFLQSGLKFLDRGGIGQLRIWSCMRNAVGRAGQLRRRTRGRPANLACKIARITWVFRKFDLAEPRWQIARFLDERENGQSRFDLRSRWHCLPHLPALPHSVPARRQAPTDRWSPSRLRIQTARARRLPSIPDGKQEMTNPRLALHR